MGYFPTRIKATNLPIGWLARTNNSTGFGPNISYAILCQAPSAVVVNRIGCYVSTQAGNIDLAILDNDGTSGDPGTLLASTGSISCPAAGFHESTITDTTLPEGLFWLALGVSNTGAGFGYGSQMGLVDVVGSSLITAANTVRAVSSFPVPTGGSWGAGTAFPMNLWVRYVR